MMLLKHIREESGGAFIAYEDDHTAGRMTYTNAGESRIIIDHTEVDNAFRGKNVGRILLDEAVKYSRENNLKIIPLCPFAKSRFEKDKTISDVLIK